MSVRSISHRQEPVSGLAQNTTAREYPDQLITDNRGTVRVSELAPNTRLVIAGREFRAGDVLLSDYVLDCAHTGKGIQVNKGDSIYCPDCGEQKPVARAGRSRATK